MLLREFLAHWRSFNCNFATLEPAKIEFLWKHESLVTETKLSSWMFTHNPFVISLFLSLSGSLSWFIGWSPSSSNSSPEYLEKLFEFPICLIRSTSLTTKIGRWRTNTPNNLEENHCISNQITYTDLFDLTSLLKTSRIIFQ